MSYDVNYSNIMNDIPGITKEVILEAMKLYYQIRYVLNYDKTIIPDDVLVAATLFISLLKTNSIVKSNMNKIGIRYEDVIKSLGFDDLKVVTLNNEYFRKIYYEHYYALILKIYTVAEWENKSFEYKDFLVEYINYFLFKKNMIKHSNIRDILLDTYGYDRYYEAASELADELVLQLKKRLATLSMKYDDTPNIADIHNSNLRYYGKNSSGKARILIHNFRNLNSDEKDE